MDLNNKNGQPSMEEILASIRRIIAEEPTAANPVIDLHAKYRQKADDHDEGNDFELPSIFRPAAPTPERQPLFGRLTDAIRNASGSPDQKPQQRRASEGDGAETQERYRGALRESGTILALANGQGGLDGVGGNGAHQNGEERYRGALRDSSGAGSLTSALSSLKLTRGAESSPLGSRPDSDALLQSNPAPVAPVPAPVQMAAAPSNPAPSNAPASASSGVEDVRRVMVPFKDMRMSRMSNDTPAAPGPSDAGALEALLYSTSPSEPVHHTLTPDFPAPPVQEAFQAQMPPPPQAFEENNLSLDDMHRFAAVMEPQRQPPPPPPVTAASEANAIEDTTADLLRPMLRQWLSENMPRMVEKALSIELAESVKSNRKFSGG